MISNNLDTVKVILLPVSNIINLDSEDYQWEGNSGILLLSQTEEKIWPNILQNKKKKKQSMKPNIHITVHTSLRPNSMGDL